MELSVLATNASEWMDLANVWQRKPDAEASPVDHLTLPIEHYDNGRIRAVLHAGKAAVMNTGMIWAWQVTVDRFDSVGAPDGRIEADDCLYDRTTRRGYCADAVMLVQSNATIRGTGLYWTMATQRMRILSNAVVRLQHGFASAGSGTGATRSKAHGEGGASQDRGGTPK